MYEVVLDLTPRLIICIVLNALRSSRRRRVRARASGSKQTDAPLAVI